MTIRQYNMLAQFGHRNYTIQQALQLEQRTFGTLCKHHWVWFDAETNEFFRTDRGDEEFQFYYDRQRLFRTNTSRPFSSFVPKRVNRVVSIKRRAA